MKFSALIRAAAFALTVSCAAFAQNAGTKIGIINIQDAITRTQEGQQLVQKLQAKYEPKSAELEQMQNEINNLRDQLQKGQNTMSDDARRNLIRQIEQKQRDQQRAMEDARGEFNREQQEIFNTIGGKLMNVIDAYSRENGYSIVLNVSPESSVLYAVNEVNITDEIIKRYDATGGAAAAQ